jgi:hypothetical protein
MRELSELQSVSNGMEVADKFFPATDRPVTEEPRQVTPVNLHGEAAAASHVAKKAADVAGMTRESLNAMRADNSVDEAAVAAWRRAARRRRWKGRAGGMAAAGQKVRVSVFGLWADRFSFKLGRSWWALPLL